MGRGIEMETETQPQDIWVFLEDETKKHPKRTKELFEWSLNYDHKDRPFNLFLDLIGWSDENYGVKMHDSTLQLGYVEADYLGKALMEWANKPQQIEAWVTELMSCEG
jgi:hypothetical protein